VLATRLQAGDAPDSWQGHAGQELIGTYVAANQLEPVNFLYEQEGWLDVMPADPDPAYLPRMGTSTQCRSTSTGRMCCGITRTDPAGERHRGAGHPGCQWIEAMEKLDAAGVLPLAMGEQWTAMHLFETVLLASLGPGCQYNDIWNGTIWTGAAMPLPSCPGGLQDCIRPSPIQTPLRLSWQDAAQLVVDGDAAFNVMGDWAEGFFRELGKEPERRLRLGSRAWHRRQLPVPVRLLRAAAAALRTARLPLPG
jgi:glucose/mannose transport system substrate-binding protein